MAQAYVHSLQVFKKGETYTVGFGSGRLEASDPVWKGPVRNTAHESDEYDNKVCLLIQPEREPEQEPEQEPEPTTALQPWLLPDGVGLD